MTQLQRLLAVCEAGGWFTLHELVEKVGSVSEAGISARLREARSKGWTVDRKRVAPGRNLYLYKITPRGQGTLFSEVG